MNLSNNCAIFLKQLPDGTVVICAVGIENEGSLPDLTSDSSMEENGKVKIKEVKTSDEELFDDSLESNSSSTYSITEDDQDNDIGSEKLGRTYVVEDPRRLSTVEEAQSENETDNEKQEAEITPRYSYKTESESELEKLSYSDASSRNTPQTSSAQTESGYTPLIKSSALALLKHRKKSVKKHKKKSGGKKQQSLLSRVQLDDDVNESTLTSATPKFGLSESESPSPKHSRVSKKCRASRKAKIDDDKRHSPISVKSSTQFISHANSRCTTRVDAGSLSGCDSTESFKRNELAISSCMTTPREFGEEVQPGNDQGVANQDEDNLRHTEVDYQEHQQMDKNEKSDNEDDEESKTEEDSRSEDTSISKDSSISASSLPSPAPLEVPISVSSPIQPIEEDRSLPKLESFGLSKSKSHTIIAYPKESKSITHSLDIKDPHSNFQDSDDSISGIRQRAERFVRKTPKYEKLTVKMLGNNANVVEEKSIASNCEHKCSGSAKRSWADCALNVQSTYKEKTPKEVPLNPIKNFIALNKAQLHRGSTKKTYTEIFLEKKAKAEAKRVEGIAKMLGVKIPKSAEEEENLGVPNSVKVIEERVEEIPAQPKKHEKQTHIPKAITFFQDSKIAETPRHFEEVVNATKVIEIPKDIDHIEGVYDDKVTKFEEIASDTAKDVEGFSSLPPTYVEPETSRSTKIKFDYLEISLDNNETARNSGDSQPSIPKVIPRKEKVQKASREEIQETAAPEEPIKISNNEEILPIKIQNSEIFEVYDETTTDQPFKRVENSPIPEVQYPELALTSKPTVERVKSKSSIPQLTSRYKSSKELLQDSEVTSTQGIYRTPSDAFTSKKLEDEKTITPQIYNYEIGPRIDKLRQKPQQVTNSEKHIQSTLSTGFISDAEKSSMASEGCKTAAEPDKTSEEKLSLKEESSIPSVGFEEKTGMELEEVEVKDEEVSDKKKKKSNREKPKEEETGKSLSKSKAKKDKTPRSTSLPPLKREEMNQDAKNNNYKPYTLRDYRQLQLDIQLGGLGPNSDRTVLQEKLQKYQRQATYAQQVMERNRKLLETKLEKAKTTYAQVMQEATEPAKVPRQRGLEYAKQIRKPVGKLEKEESSSPKGGNSNKQVKLPPLKPANTDRWPADGTAKSTRLETVVEEDPSVSGSQSPKTRPFAMDSLMENVEKLRERHAKEREIVEQLFTKEGKEKSEEKKKRKSNKKK